MNQNERRRQRLIEDLDAWPRRDVCRSIGHNLWRFAGDRAISGNLIITRQEWQKEHWREMA